MLVSHTLLSGQVPKMKNERVMLVLQNLRDKRDKKKKCWAIR